jgi:hypothetical protein
MRTSATANLNPRFSLRRSVVLRANYRATAGLWALVIVPRAPNFFALRRVSSNFERA